MKRRDIFLQRAGAMLRMRGRFTDSDVADVVKLAMAGLGASTGGLSSRSGNSSAAMGPGLGAAYAGGSGCRPL